MPRPKQEINFMSSNKMGSESSANQSARRKKLWLTLAFATATTVTAAATTFAVISKITLANANDKVIKLEQDLKDSYATIEELKVQIKANEQEIIELKNKIPPLEEKLKTVQAEVAKYEAIRAGLQSQVDEWIKTGEGDATQIKILEDQIAEQDKTITGLNGQIADLKAENEKLNETISNQQTEIANLKSQLATLSKKYSGLFVDFVQNLFVEKIKTSFDKKINLQHVGDKKDYIQSQLTILWKELIALDAINKWNNPNDKVALQFWSDATVNMTDFKINLSIQVGYPDYKSESIKFVIDYVDETQKYINAIKKEKVDSEPWIKAWQAYYAHKMDWFVANVTYQVDQNQENKNFPGFRTYVVNTFYAICEKDTKFAGLPNSLAITNFFYQYPNKTKKVIEFETQFYLKNKPSTTTRVWRTIKYQIK